MTFLGAFCDGVKLCALVAALQGQERIAGMKKKPKNRHEMIENVTLALMATKHDKVKTVNIGKCLQRSSTSLSQLFTVTIIIISVTNQICFITLAAIASCHSNRHNYLLSQSLSSSL